WQFLPGLIIAAHADLQTRDFRRAEDELKKATAKADTAESRYLTAALYTSGRNLKLATDNILESILRYPTLLDAYAMRAFQLAVLVPNDGPNQALTLFDAILQRNPKHDSARIGKAVILLQQKKFKQADPIIRELAHDDKLSGDVWVALAAADLEVNDRA